MKVVGRAGSGLDNIDVPYATQKGVIVCNTPESNVMSAADCLRTGCLPAAATSCGPTASSRAASGGASSSRA